MTTPRSSVRRGLISVPVLLAALTITACAAPVPTAPQPSEADTTEASGAPQ